MTQAEIPISKSSYQFISILDAWWKHLDWYWVVDSEQLCPSLGISMDQLNHWTRPGTAPKCSPSCNVVNFKIHIMELICTEMGRIRTWLTDETLTIIVSHCERSQKRKCFGTSLYHLNWSDSLCTVFGCVSVCFADLCYITLHWGALHHSGFGANIDQSTQGTTKVSHLRTVLFSLVLYFRLYWGNYSRKGNSWWDYCMINVQKQCSTSREARKWKV